MPFHLRANRFGDPAGSDTIPVTATVLMTSSTVAGVPNGLLCRYNAAWPATCGEAIDVPDNTAAAVSLVHQADVMFTPGSNTSTHGPQLEKLARTSVLPLRPVAATVIADGADDGELPHASALELPAATTWVTPRAVDRATASLTAELRPPPRLMLATLGPVWEKVT